MFKRSGLALILFLGTAVFSANNSGTNIINTAWVFYQGGSGSDSCTLAPSIPYSIKGKVKDSEGKGIRSVKVVLSGDRAATYYTGEDGHYEFTDLPRGDYAVTPTSAYMNFDPPGRDYAPLTQNYENQDFESVCGECHPTIIPINNLFNPAKGDCTTIIYELNKRCHVIIRLYDLLGEPIITLIDEEKGAGSYSIDWFGKNKEESIVASGTYLLYFKAGDYKSIEEKIIVIK